MFEELDIKLSISFPVTLRTHEPNEETGVLEEFLDIVRNIFGATKMSFVFGHMVFEEKGGVENTYRVELNKTLEAQEVLKSIPAMFEEKLKLLRAKVSEKYGVSDLVNT